MPRRLRLRVPEDARGVTKTRGVITRATTLVVASLCLAAAPGPAAGEGRVAWIGFLANEATPESGPVLRQGLHDRGWVEGQNVKTSHRYAQGKLDLFPDYAEELIRIGVHVIVAAGPPAIEAARRATKTIPIVIATTDDPVANGLVASASRPGGNLTGVSLFAAELPRRRLELLMHVAGRAARIAVLWNPSNPTAALELKTTQVAARKLGVALAPVELREDAEFREALNRLKGQDADALVVLADTVTVARRRDLAAFAAKHRLPAVYPLAEFVDAGGLLAYGPTWTEAFRRVAVFVDWILRGARPGELPVEQPARVELVVNLRAAKGLGLPIPRSLLTRADRVIQ
jgi:putative ABC transport system substrate-binding protein